MQFFERVLRTALHALPVPTDNLRFVSGTAHQLSKDYTLDNFKCMALVSEDAAKDAGPEVKSASGPSLGALLYPGLQALDEQYLGVDFGFGGPDQVIFCFALLIWSLHRPSLNRERPSSSPRKHCPSSLTVDVHT